MALLLRPGAAADALVAEAERAHRLQRIDVAQVDHHRLAQGGFYPRKVEGAERVPFGDDDQRVGAFEAGVGAAGEFDAGQQRLGRFGAFGIEGDDPRSLGLQDAER